MKFCPYFSQRLVNLLNLVHGKSEHWKQCVILFLAKQHKWNVLHFSQREPFCSAPLQGLFLLCIWDNHHKDTTSRNTSVIRFHSNSLFAIQKLVR